MEQSGHIEGMLDRDQRTAKLRFFDDSDCESTAWTYSLQERAANEPSSPTGLHCCHPARTKSGGGGVSSTLRASCRRAHPLNIVQSVKNLLAIVCIIAVTLPIVNSAPISMEELPPEYWLNPCNHTDIIKSSDSPTKINSKDFDKIVTGARRAQRQAKVIMEKYISEVVKNTEFPEDHKLSSIKWLPSLSLDVNNLEVDKVLSDTYLSLQRAAVGLDLTVLDHGPGETMLQDFKNAEDELKRVLCELWQIIVESNRTVPEPIHRDIVTDDDKNLDETRRQPRNYIILRNYIDTLDSIINVFGSLRDME